MPVPLRQLRAVAAVTACTSVSGAARVLHQSPSSITRGVQAAETALGIPLFERGSRGMAPTEAARLLSLRIERAQRVLQSAADGLRQHGAPAAASALPRLVNDTLLQALVARAEHPSESAAAMRLGLSQSALHQSLRRLEHLARVPLFERTRAGARLTEAGRWMLQHTRLALAEIRIGHEELARRHGLGRGHVAIGALPMAGDVLVPRAVSLALRADPGLSLTVKDGTYESLCLMLRSAEVDFIVGPLRRQAVATDLAEETLFVDRFVAVARQGHPLLRPGGKATLRQMARYPWIAPLPGTPAQAVFERLFARAGLPPPQVTLRAHSAAVVRSVLLSGDHLALLSPLQVHAEVQAGLLAHLSAPMGDTERSIGITQRRNALPSSACEAVLAALRQVSAGTAQLSS